MTKRDWSVEGGWLFGGGSTVLASTVPDYNTVAYLVTGQLSKLHSTRSELITSINKIATSFIQVWAESSWIHLSFDVFLKQNGQDLTISLLSSSVWTHHTLRLVLQIGNAWQSMCSNHMYVMCNESPMPATTVRYLTHSCVIANARTVEKCMSENYNGRIRTPEPPARTVRVSQPPEPLHHGSSRARAFPVIYQYQSQCKQLHLEQKQPYVPLMPSN